MPRYSVQCAVSFEVVVEDEVEAEDEDDAIDKVYDEMVWIIPDDIEMGSSSFPSIRIEDHVFIDGYATSLTEDED